MIHTNGHHRPREQGSLNREATSPSPCNGARTLSKDDQPKSTSDSDVHRTTKDQHARRKEKKAAAGCENDTRAKKGDNLVSEDVTHGRIPAMRDQGSNEDITAMLHVRHKEQQSPDGKREKGTVRGSCIVGGSTDCSGTKGKNKDTSPNGHVYSSPPKLEKETSPPKCRNSECSPPKISTKCESSKSGKCSTQENSSDLTELEKHGCSDDEAKDRHKPVDDRACPDETESCVKSVDAPNEKCDSSGEMGSSGDVDSRVKSTGKSRKSRSSEKKVKDSRSESLSLLIARMRGTISGVTPTEDVESASDSDDSDSADDESGDINSGSSDSDGSDTSSEEDDMEEEEEDRETEKAAGPSGPEPCHVEDKVTSGQDSVGAHAEVNSPSHCQKDRPENEKPCAADNNDSDGPLPTSSIDGPLVSGPLADKPEGPDDDEIHLNDDSPQPTVLPVNDLHHPSSGKTGEGTVEPVTDGDDIVDCDDVEAVESDDSVMSTEKQTFLASKDSSILHTEPPKPATHPQKDSFPDTVSTSNLSTDTNREGVAKSRSGNEYVYSLFEKPAPLTKKRAAAFASTDLDRYLAKHSDIQQALLPKGERVEASGKTNVSQEKDIVEIDGITFTSFPTREMLRTHIAQEKQRVRYIDTATMLQQKWGGGATKAEPTLVDDVNASGWQKTDDVHKIKGWKKRLLSTDADAASAVEVTVSCKSERLHWRSEEKLVKMLTPEQLKDMGLKLKHKRRRHTPYTQSKHHAASDATPLTMTLTDASPRQSVNFGDTELKGAGDRNPFVIKIFGRKSDGKFAPKRKTDDGGSGRKKQKVYSGLLSGSPSSVQKFQTMLDRKNLSVGLSTKFCSDLETSHKFRIIDNQLIASVGDAESWVTVAHQRMDTDASELPESVRRLDAVMLTPSMALAAVATVQQPARAPCKKPGCRYSCVCHLCDVTSTDDGDTVDFDPVTIKTCDKEYCRLGCICDTADSTSGGSLGNQGCSVLDTSIDSSFDNTCSFIDDDAMSSHNTSSDAVDIKNRHSTGSMAQKRHGAGAHDRGGKIKKRSSTGDIPIIPKEGFSQELAALLLPGATTGSVTTETTTTTTESVVTPTGVRKSSRLKDKCGIGIVDRLRSLIYFDTAFWLQDDKPRKQKVNSPEHCKVACTHRKPTKSDNKLRLYYGYLRAKLKLLSKLKQPKPQPQQQKQQQLQEQQPQHQLQYSRVKNLVRNSTITSHQENITTVELSSDDDDELVPKASRKRRRYKAETDRATASATTSSSYRSFTKNLSCPQQTPSPPTPGFTTQMVVLERNSKLYTSQCQSNALPHLLEIESDCNWQDGRYKILSDIARLADSASGYPQPLTLQVEPFQVRILEKPSTMTNIPPHLQKTLKAKQMYAVRVQITEARHDKPYGNAAAAKTPTFSNYWAETDGGKVVTGESGFRAVAESPYAPRRSAQVEEARQALEQARKALTTELEKVKREREESYEAMETTAGRRVKEEADALPLDDAVKVERGSLLKSSLLSAGPPPHAVPVAVVPNVAHSIQFNDGVTDMTCLGGYDGCDDPVTEVAYDTSCHDELDAAAVSSIDDLLMTDESSSLENTNGTLEDSSSGISSSLKSEGDGESCDYIDPVGGVDTTSMSHESRRRSKLVLADYLGDRHEKNAVKVTKERVRRGQLSVKFENLRKLLLPLKIPGQKLSKQLILSTAVKAVHNVSKANKRWLEQMRRELQRQAVLMQRLGQLKGHETTPQRSANMSQEVVPPKHSEVPKRVDAHVDEEVYAVSSASSEDEDASVVLS